MITVLAKPETKFVRELSYLGESESHQQLIEWNDTYADYPQGLCIHQLFEAQVRKTPDAIALVMEEQELSYGALNCRANQLAHYLGNKGIGPESRVGVCIGRSFDMVIALLGIMKTGACYVPLDPDYPESRRHYIQQDSEIKFIITHSSIALTSTVPSVCLDLEWETKIARNKTTDVVTAVHASNLAYIIYTSGSTGKPKGVAIQHESAVSLLTWSADQLRSLGLKSVLQNTSMCFDLSIYELFVPLCHGGECLLIDNILLLNNYAQKERVSVINTVPSAISALLTSDSIPRKVQMINLAGERLKPWLVDALYGQTNVKQVNDLYGPSEGTTYSTYTKRQENGLETIGKTFGKQSVLYT